MGRVRYLLTLALATVMIAACGGDDSPDTPPAPPPQAGAGATAEERGTARSRRRERRRGSDGKRYSSPSDVSGSNGEPAQKGSAELPSPATTRAKYRSGASRVVYHEARLRCLTIPRRSLANAYGAEADDSLAIATAYAKRESPAPAYRPAVRDGCLDGLSTNRR